MIENGTVTESALNQCAGPFGAVYDFYIERRWLMLAIGRLAWGIDASVLYDSLDSVGVVDAGATILDVPCGGGVALRALSPHQDVRYVGADLSEDMLQRASRRARRLGLAQAEFVHADMLELPFDDGHADVFLAFSGLHMTHEPERAVAEIARCLKPGGEVIGTTFLGEGSRRQRALFGLGHRRGHALPPTADSLERWFAAAGIDELTIAPRMGFAAFRGRRVAT
jgi:ubiquinone/menaquinone biosynthesis C-methylase UbiE